ncbi:hypothetical protein ABIA69_004436 [Lysinibacillus parviboronicapiens]|uniref:Uncharacterized protein n=1 Tax=Lysinibacillus parviboronicapiens TaxID=436516 RepID=A0ABV2PQL8_9BACI
MKFTKLAAISALTLALAGTSMASAMADEKETINTNIQENEESIIDSNHEEYFGSDSWKWVRSGMASYINQPLVNGEFKNSFQVGTSKYDIRYNIANRGSNNFTWKIYTPGGSIWSSGTLKPGESKTYTAWADLDSIPVGEYKISIISSNGGPGAFDFAVRSLN